MVYGMHATFLVATHVQLEKARFHLMRNWGNISCTLYSTYRTTQIMMRFIVWEVD
jgi:hypothetical protein